MHFLLYFIGIRYFGIRLHKGSDRSPKSRNRENRFPETSFSGLQFRPRCCTDFDRFSELSTMENDEKSMAGAIESACRPKIDELALGDVFGSKKHRFWYYFGCPNGEKRRPGADRKKRRFLTPNKSTKNGPARTWGAKGA